MSSPIQQALQLAKDRGLLPSALSARETADLANALESRVFWSARTAHKAYLAGLKKLVEKYITGEGYEADIGQLRLEARALLIKYGYTPEGGFPGEAAQGIPSALPGTLRDLRSERRLNLIFETQASLARGLGQKIRGLSRLDQFPAWELVRAEGRRVPRDWEERWAIAADNVDGEGIARTGGFIALKTSPIWAALGSRELFDDALDVDHSPFAFQSGMALQEVDFRRARELELTPPASLPALVSADSTSAPAWVGSEDFLGGDKTINELKARLEARRRKRNT